MLLSLSCCVWVLLAQLLLHLHSPFPQHMPLKPSFKTQHGLIAERPAGPCGGCGAAGCPWGRPQGMRPVMLLGEKRFGFCLREEKRKRPGWFFRRLKFRTGFGAAAGADLVVLLLAPWCGDGGTAVYTALCRCVTALQTCFAPSAILRTVGDRRGNGENGRLQPRMGLCGVSCNNYILTSLKRMLIQELPD